MTQITLLMFSYLLGALPFGFIVAKLVKKIDIRKFGSGNIGATNVFRVVGRKWGITVFILDFQKGFIPPFIVKTVLIDAGMATSNYIFILSAILLVCGHNWTPFLGFKGGKGVSTSLGAATALSFIFPNLWLVVLLTIVSWAVVFYLSKYVSVASLSAAFSFFILSLILSQPIEIKVLALLFFILIVVRHKGNIEKLMKKRENRF